MYPVIEAKNSNMRHRPIGIGVQGLADALQQMKVAFTDPKAQEINQLIFETIYHAAMETSIELAEQLGHYESFKGSPLSEGKFQFDLWGVEPASKRYDWAALRERVKKSGARNSLLLAPMPTASTSQILGNNESFEPYTSNVYTRRVLAGEFVCVNPHLVKDLIDEGLWTTDVKNALVGFNGQLDKISAIPEHIKELYKTVWEIPQRILIDLAAGRGPYICQSQSLNLYLPEPTFGKMTSMHFYGWEKGLKTGQYYLRSRPARDAIKFTVNVEALLKASDEKNTEALLNCLNQNNQQQVDERKRKRKRDEPKETNGAAVEKKEEPMQEEEEIEFECMNCSS